MDERWFRSASVSPSSKPFGEDVNIYSGASFATNGIQTCRQHPHRELRFVLASGCLLFTHPSLWQPAGLRLLLTPFCLEARSGLLGRQLQSFELKPRPLAHPAGSHASEEQMAKSKLTNGPPSHPPPQMKGNIFAWNFFSCNANPKRSRPVLISHPVWTRLNLGFFFFLRDKQFSSTLFYSIVTI